MAVMRFRRTYYTPEDNVKSQLDALPALALRSIDVEIYGLTDMVLIGGLIAAAKAGVHIRVMNDRSQSCGPSDHAALEALVSAGYPNISVRVVRSTHGAIDHLKLMILDGEDGAMADTSSVFMGSYNFSDGAQKQDNLAIWTNDPGEVAQAQSKFDLDWQQNPAKPEWQVQPL